MYRTFIKFSIYICLAVFCFGCGKMSDDEELCIGNQYFETEEAFKTFAKSNPDSALILLKTELDHFEKSSEQKEKFQKILLFTELAFRNYQPVTNDSLMLSVVQYYDSVFINDSVQKNKISIENQFIRAKSHHLLGKIYQSNYLYLKAMQHDLISLKILDQYFSEQPHAEVYQLRASLNSSIGDMFYDCEFFDVAKNLYFNSVENYLLSGDSIFIAAAYRKVGNICYYLGDHQKPDTLFYYLQKSLSYNQNVYITPLLYTLTGLYYVFIEMPDSVYSDHQKVMEIMPHGDDLRYSLLKTASFLFYITENYDSALLYALKEYESPDYKIKCDAAEKMVSIYRKLGNEEKAAEFAEIQKYYQNYFTEIRRIYAGINTLYIDYEKNKNNTIIYRHQRFPAVYWISGGIIAMALALYFLFRRKRKKPDKSLKEIHAASVQKVEPSNVAETDSQLMQRYLEQWDKLQKTDIFDTLMHRCGNEKDLTTQNVVYSQASLTLSEMRLLQETIDCLFNGFTKKLYALKPTLTKIEMEYCCLSIFELTELQKAALLSLSYQGLTSRCKRTCKSLDITKKSADANDANYLQNQKLYDLLKAFLLDFLRDCLK